MSMMKLKMTSLQVVKLAQLITFKKNMNSFTVNAQMIFKRFLTLLTVQTLGLQ